MGTRFGLRVGDVVRVSEEVALPPYATICQGETGVVQTIDDDEVWIKLAVVHRGLREWDNCIWINRDTPEISRAIEPIRARARFSMRRLSTVSAASYGILKLGFLGKFAVVGSTLASAEAVVVHWVISLYAVFT